MIDPLSASAQAVDIAAAVRGRTVSASEVVEAALRRIESANAALNAFTAVNADPALEKAATVDARIAAGEDPGPLAGVPFAAKSQLDIAGITTTAGSKLLANAPPAERDAGVVAALDVAGAICLGALNMDEFGLGGTTENSHYGATRNPHDRSRVPGGSSGGTAAAVAAGMVPIALGTDGLGSVRLPASLCGVFGLRPSEGSVSRRGLRPAPGSLAIPGPMARSVLDMANTFDAMRIGSASAASCVGSLKKDVGELRVAQAVGGSYDEPFDQDVAEVIGLAAGALGITRKVEYPEPDRARAAAMLIMSAEGATTQAADLQNRLDLFDPRTRDRFLAGAMIPASWYLEAMKFRAWHRAAVLALFHDVDVLLMPATPCVAPVMGTETVAVGGLQRPIGPALGYFVQPVAPTGCAAMTVPIVRPGKLPMGVQLVAALGREANLMITARALEREGTAGSPVALA